MSSSKPSPARRIATALLPITALSLAACGSLPFSSSSPSSSAPATTAAASPSATPSATASASASASASATASATDTASATASGDPSASASSGTNGLTPENTKGRELRLSDFQQPSSASSWNEKQYDVASSTGVMGIGTDLDWQHNGTFNAGQANDSKSSDLTVKVQIFADGKEIDTVNVPFNDAHAFDVDVANVNALKITLTPLDRMQLMPSMGLHTTGVIFNVKAE